MHNINHNKVRVKAVKEKKKKIRLCNQSIYYDNGRSIHERDPGRVRSVFGRRIHEGCFNSFGIKMNQSLHDDLLMILFQSFFRFQNKNNNNNKKVYDDDILFTGGKLVVFE